MDRIIASSSQRGSELARRRASSCVAADRNASLASVVVKRAKRQRTSLAGARCVCYCCCRRLTAAGACRRQIASAAGVCDAVNALSTRHGEAIAHERPRPPAPRLIDSSTCTNTRTTNSTCINDQRKLPWCSPTKTRYKLALRIIPDSSCRPKTSRYFNINRRERGETRLNVFKRGH